MTIAITGANGRLGRAIMERLISMKVPASDIAACVRSPEAALAYEEQGIEARHCDYDDPETMEAAFAGVSKLLLISSPHSDDTVRLRQHAAAIEAAKRAGVERLLYTGFAFAENGSTSLSSLHLATEWGIRASGIPYTFVRNALYLDMIEMFGVREAVETGELRVPPGDWTFNFALRSDLADAIASVLADGTGQHDMMSYNLTAPAPWTFEDLADTLSRIAQKPVTVRIAPEHRNWAYGFVSRCDTSSVSEALNKLAGTKPRGLLQGVREILNAP